MKSEFKSKSSVNKFYWFFFVLVWFFCIFPQVTNDKSIKAMVKYKALQY